MERCRVEDISPSMFLRHIDRHLEGDAYQWMRNTENVRALICKGYMNLATESDVETFRGALSERFKLTDKEAQEVYEEMPIVRLCRLKQGTSEDLEEYYNRVRLYFLEFHGDDGENGALAPSHKLVRSMVVSRFVSGLRTRWPARLRMRLKSQQIYHHSVNLHQAFKMAEAEIKIMNTEQGREKSEEKERERKRKLVIDEKEQDNAKKQKQKVVIQELPTATKDDESSSSSDPSGWSSNSGDDVGESLPADKAWSSQRSPASAQLENTPKAKPTPELQWPKLEVVFTPYPQPTVKRHVSPKKISPGWLRR